MAVLLRRSDDLPGADLYHVWTSVGPRGDDLPGPRIEGEARALEAAFAAAAPGWFDLARRLAAHPDSWLAHMPVCAPNASDFGLMLAWSELVAQWGAADRTTLVLCDDPWLFRHLAGLAGVRAGTPPPLRLPALKLWLRGYASRLMVAVRMARAAWALRGQRRQVRPGSAALMVYGHPKSSRAGDDAYFGPLMHEIPALTRILHTDCLVPRARALADDQGRTLSLHAFANPLAALSLPWRRWRPRTEFTRGEMGWLVRRAAAREGGSGQAAMIAWQRHCQARWLRAARPSVVAWPWESHAWERAFIPAARAMGARTLGYQHSVVGMQLNFAAASVPSDAHVPDLIACNGASARDQVLAYGHDAGRLRVGGALRFANPPVPAHDPDGPVFLAVPFDGRVAAQMVDAARPLGAKGWRFVVKDHPLTPFFFKESPGVTRTAIALENQPGLRAVVFAATTVGLEAVLAGLPTLRFLPRGCIALDILPKDCEVRPTDAETLERDLLAATASVPPRRSDIFAPVDLDFWKKALS